MMITSKEHKLKNLLLALNDFNENKDNLVKVYYIDMNNYTIKIINNEGTKVATYRKRLDRTLSGRDGDWRFKDGR